MYTSTDGALNFHYPHEAILSNAQSHKDDNNNVATTVTATPVVLL